MSRRERARFGLAGYAGTPSEGNITVRQPVVVATRTNEPPRLRAASRGPRKPQTFNPAGRYADPRGGRLNRPGELLARGPIDYDVPVLRRCACGKLLRVPLSQPDACQCREDAA